VLAQRRLAAPFLITLLALVSALPSPALAHYSRTGAIRCGFAPRSPGVGSDEGLTVWARRVSCRTARRVAGDYAYGGQPHPSGFTCIRRVRQQGDRQSGIAHTDYRCSLARRVIVFEGT
jgi:hypothetical protein